MPSVACCQAKPTILSHLWYDRQVHNIIEGVIEGETRVFSAGLTIKEMFEDREKFRKTVQDKVGSVEMTKHKLVLL